MRWLDIQTTAQGYAKAARTPNAQPMNPQDFQHLSKIVGAFEFIGGQLDLEETQYQTGLFGHALDHEPSTCQTVDALLRHLITTATKEMNGKVVVFIPKERARYFNKDAKEALFGSDVYTAFPEARDDIKYAGNCISADLNTAAVFHLMRTVEHGMRSLANHLGVKIRNRTLESADWGTLIKAIRAKIELRQQKYDKSKRKKKGEFKKLDFYRAITDEMNVFRQNWRNNTMHTRSSYKASEAVGVFDRVCDFMQRLVQGTVG